MSRSTAFDAGQFDLAYPDGIEAHWWQRARSAILARELYRLDLTDAEILEVGCGRGAAVLGLAGRGVRCRGVELADVPPIEGARNLVRCGLRAEDLPAAERRSYGVLLLLDVIEHLPEPEVFLLGLAEAFPRVEDFVLTVPARRELWSNYDDFYGHYRRYDLVGISELATELGWTVRAAAYFFHALYLPMRVLGLLGRERSVAMVPPRGTVQRAVHGILASVSVADFRLFSRRLPGASIVACLRRPPATAWERC